MRLAYWSIVGVGLMAAFPVFAHERWFVDDAVRGEIPALFSSFRVETAAVGGAFLFAAIVLTLLDRRRRTRQAHPILRQLEPWMPTIVGIGTGITLVAAALDRTLFGPNLILPDGPFGSAAVVIELTAGILLATGLFARAAAGALILLTALCLAWFRVAGLEQLVMAGIGGYLLVYGRGRMSLGSVLSRVLMSMDGGHLRPAAFTAYRVLMGITLAVLGVGKILRPDLHLRLLTLFPTANPYVALRTVMPPLTSEWYLLLAAFVEITGGLLVVTGAFLRPVSLILLVPFLVFPFFFGAEEIIGHLPLMATLIAFAVIGNQRGVRE